MDHRGSFLKAFSESVGGEGDLDLERFEEEVQHYAPVVMIREMHFVKEDQERVKVEVHVIVSTWLSVTAPFLDLYSLGMEIVTELTDWSLSHFIISNLESSGPLEIRAFLARHRFVF